MESIVPEQEATRPSDLADWRAFALAYYEPIVRALRILHVPDAESGDLAHSFLVKASEKDFLDKFRAFQSREAAAGRVARFRNYLYRSIHNHVHDVHRRAASKGKGLSLHPDEASRLQAAPVRTLDPDAIYALAVLHQALQALRTHCERTGRPHLWVVFEEFLLADEIRGRRARSRAELLREFGATSPAFIDNSLTTAKRAFRRFVQEVIPRWPGGRSGTAERFEEWMDALRRSDASQFQLLQIAYRVSPYVDHSREADSVELVVAEVRPQAEDEPAPAPSDDELSILLSFRLELPISQLIDARELVDYLPAAASARGRRAPAAPRVERSLCLLSLISPTPDESEALVGGDVLRLLARLKSLNKQLRHKADGLNDPWFTELFYTVICILALVRYDAVLYSIGSATLAANARWFLARPWLDDRLRPLLLAGVEAHGRQAAVSPQPRPTPHAETTPD